MRASFLVALIILLLAGIALLFGLSLVFGVKDASMQQRQEMSSEPPNQPTNSPPHNQVDSGQDSQATKLSDAQTPIPETETIASEAVGKLVKSSVLFLEEGNSERSLVDMRSAIALARESRAEPAELDALGNMLMRIEYCAHGPRRMLAWLETGEGALALSDSSSPTSIDRMRMKIEALLALGRLQESWDESKLLLKRFEDPKAPPMLEPLALEQAIRIAGTAGATDQIPALEKKLRASVEAGIELKTLRDPLLPLATLGSLAKERGECAYALKLYDQVLEGFDTNTWLREKRVAPWRMEVLALMAMDRVDCLRQTGQIERAKGRASALAADLATALGDNDPLAIQAGDLRDQIVYSNMAP